MPDRRMAKAPPDTAVRCCCASRSASRNWPRRSAQPSKLMDPPRDNGWRESEDRAAPDPYSARPSATPSRRLILPLGDFGLRRRQSLRLDQQALAFIATARAAEAD